jgi:hypothetical protein
MNDKTKQVLIVAGASVVALWLVSKITSSVTSTANNALNTANAQASIFEYPIVAVENFLSYVGSLFSGSESGSFAAGGSTNYDGSGAGGTF